MIKVRYICFNFMFLYSLAVFISLPKGRPEEEQKFSSLQLSSVAQSCPTLCNPMNGSIWWGLKTQLSNIKSGIWLLHRATTPTSPFSPDGTSETPRNTKYFPSSPVGWSVQEETFSDQKSSVFSVQSSPSPHSQCLSSYGLPGLGPKLKGCHLPPFSHTWPIPFFPRHYQKTDTQTYLFTTCWYFSHRHLTVLASTEGTISVVWSLHKWLVCQGFSYNDSRLLKVSGSR